MVFIENQDTFSLIKTYPDIACEKLLFLRNLIIETALDIENESIVHETLKWGEPSYTSKNGSTIRIDWKEEYPDQYMMYFHCKTKLIDTFKEIYSDTFIYDGNRAIIFNIAADIPTEELKHCIQLSLTYHSIKHLPLLGV